MQITKTLADGLDLLGYILSKPPDAGHWTPPELVAYLDAAQKEIALKLPSPLLGPTLANQDGATSIVDNQEYVSLPVTYARFLSGYRFFYLGNQQTKKRLLVKKTVEYIDSIKVNANYSNLMVRTTYIAEFGSQFYFFPPLSAGESWLVSFVRSPIPFTAGTTSFSVIDDVYEIVVYYAAFLASIKDKPSAENFIGVANTKVTELNLRYGTDMPLLIPQVSK